MKHPAFIIGISAFIILFLSCAKSGLSRKEAEKAIRYAFSTFIMIQSNGTSGMTEKDELKVHDLKGPGDGELNTVVLGMAPDSVRLIQAESKEKGHYVATATLIRKWTPDGNEFYPMDTIGGVFAIFKSGEHWEALPLSGFIQVKNLK